MTSERKMLATVCAIALAGLVLDRVALAPEEAGAEVTLLEPRALQNEFAAAPEAPAEAQPPLSRRLAVLAAAHGVSAGEGRDAFCYPESWRAAGEGSKDLAADNFTAAHRLAAVVKGDQGHVIVNGNLVRIGQELGGFTLVAVGARSADFQRGDERVTLTLE